MENTKTISSGDKAYICVSSILAVATAFLPFGFMLAGLMVINVADSIVWRGDKNKIVLKKSLLTITVTLFFFAVKIMIFG
ncbi:MAG: hypothetical protein LBN08_04350 [Lactobacillales bacterium]|nr:hypothetical protein [Lactobacillales bacterium]